MMNEIEEFLEQESLKNQQKISVYSKEHQKKQLIELEELLNKYTIFLKKKSYLK